MSMRLWLLAGLLCIVPTLVFADETEEQAHDVAEEGFETVIESNTEPEAVEFRQSLAVHMGLAPNDVVFGKPRNFRSESLNNFQLDPLNETDDN